MPKARWHTSQTLPEGVAGCSAGRCWSRGGSHHAADTQLATASPAQQASVQVKWSVLGTWERRWQGGIGKPLTPWRLCTEGHTEQQEQQLHLGSLGCVGSCVAGWEPAPARTTRLYLSVLRRMRALLCHRGLRRQAPMDTTVTLQQHTAPVPAQQFPSNNRQVRVMTQWHSFTRFRVHAMVHRLRQIPQALNATRPQAHARGRALQK